MATTATKFGQIADAIREKTGSTQSIVANNFATEIASIYKGSPMNTMEDFYNHGRGLMIDKYCAEYLYPRIEGKTYAYSQTINPWNNETDGHYHITDADGNYCADCSGFVNFILRGIRFANSPYAGVSGANKYWTPSTFINNFYNSGNNKYGLKIVDRQPVGTFKNLGFNGYWSVRNAGQQAEFLTAQGKVIFDARVDGPSTSTFVSDYDLQPGDIIFWSKPQASDAQKRRFLSISHVGVIAQNRERFYEVTTITGTMLYALFSSGSEGSENWRHITLVVRPVYKGELEIPKGENLIYNPYTFNATSTSVTSAIAGLTITKTALSRLKFAGTSTAAKTIGLRGKVNSKDHITLTPGTYKLSIGGTTGIDNVDFCLKLQYTDGSEIVTNEGESSARAYQGHDCTITVNDYTNVIVLLSCANGLTLNCEITPSLTRI